MTIEKSGIDADLRDLIGSASASPEANTLLARLKDIFDDLNAKADGTAADPVKSELVGSKIAISTILNAGSVAASGSTGELDMGVQGDELEVWLEILIDQQPWTLSLGHNLSVSTSGGLYKRKTSWPSYSSHTTTYTSASGGALALALGVTYHNSGLTAPVTLQEARQLHVPPNAGLTCSIANESASTASVTIKVMRVLR